ncbi:Retrovirus-related Pol polyprotein from transposon opus [Gossypium australe]|uniref:Retrovirus-related Pol polyprotein from transposon opus n=1 Tax=Gossypium australe TaxID=47621 RepID=A0A5B6VLR9_9ROSI|nr:Retrovirus-related Pol polyprotein from transposon opus [Gossypium australe]
MVVDPSANGSLLSKSYNEAYEVIERITNKNYQWPTNQAASKIRVVRIHEVDTLTSLTAQVSPVSSLLKIFSANRPQGALPSDTKHLRNLGNEHYKAVILRSGRTLEPNATEVEDKPTEAQEKEEIKPTVETPVVQKLESMNSDECIAAKQAAPKMKDPRSFTILCNIGDSFYGRALCDLESSINLMPMSVFRQLRIGEVRPTPVTLQSMDRSLAHPEGKIKDILVCVDKFIFPADFIVLDFEADKEVQIILGRPFLEPGRTLINVQKGELSMRVDIT